MSSGGPKDSIGSENLITLSPVEKSPQEGRMAPNNSPDEHPTSPTPRSARHQSMSSSFDKDDSRGVALSASIAGDDDDDVEDESTLEAGEQFDDASDEDDPAWSVASSLDITAGEEQEENQEAEEQKVLDRIAAEDGYHADILRAQIYRQSSGNTAVESTTGTDMSANTTVNALDGSATSGSDPVPEYIEVYVWSEFADTLVMDVERAASLVNFKLRFLEFAGLEAMQIDDLNFVFGEHIIQNDETTDMLDMYNGVDIFVRPEKVQEAYLDSFERQKDAKKGQ